MIPLTHPAGLRSRRAAQATVGGLFLLAIVTLLPDFRSSVIPRSDARQTVDALHILASGLHADGEIPRWLPYGRYGCDGFIMMSLVTPASYAVALASLPFGTVDAVLLVKLVMLIEFLIFLAGSIRLSLFLFRTLEAVAFVNIAAILSFSWLISLDANLRYFYMLPLILDALFRFCRDGRATWLLLASLYCVVSAIGNVYYYPPIMALLLTVFAVALLWARNGSLPRLRFSRVDLPLALPIVILAAAHVGAYLAAFGDQHTFTFGRDPASSRAERDYYLEYNGMTRVLTLARELLTGAHTHGDVTFYTGLAPLAFAALGLRRCRRSEFIAVAVAAGFLLLFTFGGIVALASYYFPGMAYFRHLFMVFGQLRYLVFLMAGFGLEALVPDPNAPAELPRRKSRLLLSIAGVIIAAEVLISEFRGAQPWFFVLFPKGLDLDARDYVPAFLRIAAYGVLLGIAAMKVRGRPSTERVPAFVAALLFGALLDLGSFKVLQYAAWPAAADEEIALSRQAYAVRPIPWQPRRVSSNEELARNANFRFAVEKGRHSAVYTQVYSVLGVDPRIPVYRTDTLSEGLARLFSDRNVVFEMYPSEGMFPADDRWLSDAVGARLPKLRVCAESSVDFTSRDDAVRSLPKDSDRVVIDAPPPDRTPGRSTGSVAVTRFGFGGISLEATVDGPDPAWLYYADAYHPGWQAAIDGRPATIARANLAFKALPLHPGLNRVELRYRNGWSSGSLPLLCGGSVVFLAGLAVFLARSLTTRGSAGT